MATNSTRRKYFFDAPDPDPVGQPALPPAPDPAPEAEETPEGTVRRALRIAAEHRDRPCSRCQDDGTCPDLDPVKGLLAPGEW